MQSYDSLLTTNVVNLLSAIHEYKGQHTILIRKKADKPVEFACFLELAKKQSVDSSVNMREMNHAAYRQIAERVKEKAELQSLSRSEAAGYREVLEKIGKSYSYMAPRPNVILKMHRDLYKYCPSLTAGRYRETDYVNGMIGGGGTERFQPMTAYETPIAMKSLCDSLEREMDKGSVDALLLIAVFILDFLCIHPFREGNERMSWLLTKLLLDRSGYFIGQYISIEKLIEESADTYMEALHASAEGWNDSTNDYLPFVQYYLGILLKAYREFFARVEFFADETMTKPQRVEKILRTHLGKMTMEEIRDKCPDISYSTATKTLNALIAEGTVLKIGGGRYSAYIYNYNDSSLAASSK